ncbi:MAG TPA: DUF2911 domain-containing protein [Thermoanaerobaculia bacterium]|nr:DUF2911 domain-containing protein [Thermoanaerobaculia bacterium]
MQPGNVFRRRRALPPAHSAFPPLPAVALAASIALVAGLALGGGGRAAQAQAPAPAPQLPRPSPNAGVSQTIGVTEVTIRYSRPGIKGRAIWGKLVPYGQVWRTGANENTTIRFSTPVRIDGKELPAGIYGLQTIPGPDDWVVILSKDANEWGAFSYKQEDDALRFHVKPAPATEPQEWMSFEFRNLTDTSAVLALRWEKLEVAWKIEADTPRLLVAAARSDQRWQDAAAAWCIQTGTCLAEAARWIDASIAVEPTFSNQRAKARLLARHSDYKGAVAAGERALAAARASKEAPPPAQVSDLETQIADWKRK